MGLGVLLLRISVIQVAEDLVEVPYTPPSLGSLFLGTTLRNLAILSYMGYFPEPNTLQVFLTEVFELMFTWNGL